MAIRFYSEGETGKVFAVVSTPKSYAEFRLEAGEWVNVPGCPVLGAGLTGNYYEPMEHAPVETAAVPGA